MVSRRTNGHGGKTKISKRWKTKRRRRDLDQIDEDIKPQNVEKLLNQEVDFDRPGNAEFYCLHCARYFISDYALQDHFRTKVHKRRLKALELEPYTIAESERAAGFGNFQPPEKRKIETQPTKEEFAESKRMKIEQ